MPLPSSFHPHPQVRNGGNAPRYGEKPFYAAAHLSFGAEALVVFGILVAIALNVGHIVEVLSGAFQ